MASRILVIEDDENLREYLSLLFKEAGYTVYGVGQARQAFLALEKNSFDLVILDLTLPDMAGEEVCLELKKTYPDLPVIILSARDSIAEIVKGLKIGADDYITKPFKGDELLARINARLRSMSGGDVLASANLLLDTKKLEVKRGEQKINLTHTEFQLLHFLLANKGKVMSRDAILNQVWGRESEVEDRVVDVYIGYLRKKIDGGFGDKLISSVRGFGYLIRD